MGRLALPLAFLLGTCAAASYEGPRTVPYRVAQSDPGWNILPDGRVRWCWYEFHADRDILHCIVLQEWTIS